MENLSVGASVADVGEYVMIGLDCGSFMGKLEAVDRDSIVFGFES